jgi:Tfp pilus assembly protein PilN
MIRINLLGIPKAKRGKRPAAPASIGEGPSTTLLALIFVLIVGVGLWLWYNRVDHQREQVHKDLQAALLENQRLADVKAKYEARKKIAEKFTERVRLIDDLKQKQSGPVDLLNMVADTITKTDAVWLEAMTDDGKSIDFTGLALSPNAVANLMANLEKTGQFKSVEIKETSQAPEVKELQAFKFELICEKTSAKVPAPAGGTAPAGAPGAAGKTDKKAVS